MNFFVHGQVNSIQTFVSASPALKVFLMDSDINPEKEWSAGKYESSYILLLHGVDVSDSKPNADKGLEWGPYFGNGFRWVRINKDFDRSSLKKRGIDAYAFLNTEPVISGLISKENFKEVYSDTRQWKINVRVFRGFESSFVNDALVLHLEVKKLGGSYFEIDIDSAMVRKVLTLPYVMEIEPAWMPAMAVNYDNRGVHGLNILKNTLTGMRGLSGRNVYVGVGDDGNITSHIDYKDRVTDRASYAYSNHATHVGGTVGGAGLLNPRDEGMAPRVSLIGEYFTNIISATENHIRDFNMVLTNNSYHSALTTCAGNGDYGSASEFSDEQQYENDTLLHVFAAGNDGGLSCSPYPAGYHTVKSEWQCAKNALVVASMDTNYTIAASSSRGPTDDGRLKPEITAVGRNVRSTYPNNGYATISGTSMACPTTVGTLSLLVERFRQINSGRSPLMGLIKAIACNTARDAGNIGPDFIFGFGILQAERALRAIEDSTYKVLTVASGDSQTFTLSVPSGLQQVKIMLYWVDAEGNPSGVRTLVQDLDLEVVDAGGSRYLPWTLNTNPGSVASVATRGRDTINNIEQFTLDSPGSGNYTVVVKGRDLPLGAQRCFVTWDFVPPSVQLLYPNGGETFVPGQSEHIRWDAFGGSPNTFTVQYSLNNGSSWTTISSGIADTRRSIHFVVPSSATNQGLVRVVRNTAGYADTSIGNFRILGQVTVSSSVLCDGVVRLSWSSITGATDYEVMQKVGDSMQSIGTTSSTSYVVRGLSTSSTSYLSVRARNSGLPGLRSVAVGVLPSSGTCADSVCNNDIGMVSLVSPVDGRIYTSSRLSSAQTIQVRIKNVDNASTSGTILLGYQINGGSVVNESYVGSIAALGSYTHSFSTTANLSAVGTYVIKHWVNYASDAYRVNDTMTTIIRHLANDTIALPFTENFDTVASLLVSSNKTGVEGLERFDFERPLGSRGRLRTNVGYGIPKSGARCLNIDTRAYGAENNAVYAISTFNLSNFNIDSTDIRLDFSYKSHGNTSSTYDKLWVRGTDTSSWILFFDLGAEQGSAGDYVDVTTLHLRDSLRSNGQVFGASTQLRFGWDGTRSTDNNYYSDGFTIDDIRLYQIINDLELVSSVSPSEINCGLGSEEHVQVMVKNNMDYDITNVPIYVQVNGGIPVLDTIEFIASGSTAAFSFSRTFDFSSYTDRTISFWLSDSLDNVKLNDSISTFTFHNGPYISAFPYYESFESDAGNYFANGVNSTLEWGTSSKSIINKAANGTKAWYTSLTSRYNNNEVSYLYSPCFNLSTLTDPVLSFAMNFSTENDYDFIYVEYTTDGVSWNKLGTYRSGVNWYSDVFTSNWDNTNARWKVCSHDLPSGASLFVFRIVFTSDVSVTDEGFGIDDIHIFDRTAIYNGVSDPVSFKTVVSGLGWTHIEHAGRRVLSMNANGQNLDTVASRVYINTSGVRNFDDQYYLDRTWVIRPNGTVTAPVGVRLYFTDSEMEALINESSCATCTGLSDAFLSGISKFSGSESNENGSIYDNYSTWSFIPPDSVLVVPYDSGYYAEFSVNSFSEFYINGGGPSQNKPLPLVWLDFNAHAEGSSAVLEWITGTEINTDFFEVERLIKSEDRSQLYKGIGKVDAAGNSTEQNRYRFIEESADFEPIAYYRVKQVDMDGKYTYSKVKSVSFSSKSEYIVYPNPMHNSLTLSFRGLYDKNELEVQVFDIQGIKRFTKKITLNRVDKIDLTSDFEPLTSGMYMMKISAQDNTETIKIEKW